MAEQTKSRLSGAVALGLLSVVLVASVVWWLLGLAQSPDLNPWDEDKPPDLFEMARATATITAIIGAGVGVVLAYRRQKTNEESGRIAVEKHEREAITALRERFTTAAGQLGDSSTAIRLAGVYAMSALADDWIAKDKVNEAGVCVDVLCAYIRSPRQAFLTAGTHQSPAELNEARANDFAAETEVRRAIITVCRDHLRAGDAGRAAWAGLAFNFKRATVDFTFNLSQCDLRRVDFKATHFRGRASFSGSTLGDLPLFESVTFSDGVNLQQATIDPTFYAKLLDAVPESQRQAEVAAFYFNNTSISVTDRAQAIVDLVKAPEGLAA